MLPNPRVASLFMGGHSNYIGKGFGCGQLSFSSDLILKRATNHPLGQRLRRTPFLL